MAILGKFHFIRSFVQFFLQQQKLEIVRTMREATVIIHIRANDLLENDLLTYIHKTKPKISFLIAIL